MTRSSPTADVDLEPTARPLDIPGVVRVAAADPCCRLSFRGDPTAAELAGRGFGVRLPQEPCRSGTAGERAALWLGPDEWLLLAPSGDAAVILDAMGSALAGTPHALVDVSERSLGLVLEGPGSAEVLASGCPLDLDVACFPVAMCTRTLYGKAEIVLWRHAPGRFRIDVGRSYLPYVAGLLAESVRDHEQA